MIWNIIKTIFFIIVAMCLSLIVLIYNPDSHQSFIKTIYEVWDEIVVDNFKDIWRG